MAASAQARDRDDGVEEIAPEVIERRQTLISPDDLEGDIMTIFMCVCVKCHVAWSWWFKL
jgi:hypothetical protein